MAKFLYLYMGGNPPASPEAGEKIMQAWRAYFGKMGDRIVDGGAPLGGRVSVSGAPTSGPNGYSIIAADDLADAVSLTDGHPHLDAGGSIEVLETMPIPM
jgi:hypothetical protein